VCLSELQDKEYFVKIKAFVFYESQTMKFFTYPISYVNIKNPMWRNMFMIVVWAVVLMLVMIMWKKCYKRVAPWRERPREVEGETGEERRKKRRYEALEDEEVGGVGGGQDEAVSQPNDVIHIDS